MDIDAARLAQALTAAIRPAVRMRFPVKPSSDNKNMQARKGLSKPEINRRFPFVVLKKSYVQMRIPATPIHPKRGYATFAAALSEIG
jgi:hypothetical protein